MYYNKDIPVKNVILMIKDLEDKEFQSEGDGYYPIKAIYLSDIKQNVF
jgi:hypothetical protein